jgi:hypothetical protein
MNFSISIETNVFLTKKLDEEYFMIVIFHSDLDNNNDEIHEIENEF